MPPPELARPPAPAPAQRRLEAWLADDRSQRVVSAPADDVTVVCERGGGSSEYRYDRRGDLAAVTEPDGGRVAFEYDDERRLTAVRRGGGSTVFSYDDRDRLAAVEEEGSRRRYLYDDAGRLALVGHGDGSTVAYAYDGEGRVLEARTPVLATAHDYDAEGRVVAVRQTLDGVTLELGLEFDAGGRLAAMRLPGATVGYAWDERGRPSSVALDEAPLAGFAYDDTRRETAVTYVNGLVERTLADPVDGRLQVRELRRGGEVLFARRHRHDAAGRIVDDGARRYAYDDLGRLALAEDELTGELWRYRYDARDNRVETHEPGASRRWEHDEDAVLGGHGSGGDARFEHDERGRRTHAAGADGAWTYRYDAAGDLREVLGDGVAAATLLYDHKGRLAAIRRGPGTERYLYGPDDELAAVTDEAGRALRLVVRTPLGPLAEVGDPVETRVVSFLHLDHQGTCHLASDAAGEVTGRWRFCPFGVPAGDGPVAARFAGREWHAALRLYRFGARWYEPRSGRFLTPDTFTAAPDDERLVHPLLAGSVQPRARAELLSSWLQRPRIRNRFAFCANDPINRIDPNGHWSFGAALMTLLGAVWALPNTVFGLLLEVTCLIGEVVRWIVYLISSGETTWETPGFDLAASPRLNAFALVFSGGWLGSFASVPAITFGNVFFVYKNWETLPEFSGSDVVHPAAYGGKVGIPRRETLYEHELFHTRQYGQFGPFFHLGLPLFGVYEWDLLLNGRAGSVLEKDAGDHSGRTRPGADDGAGGGSDVPVLAPRAGVEHGQQYGGYDLQRGDGDGRSRYAAQTRSAGAGDRLPAPAETPYVRALQEDLRTLGFSSFGAVDGRFGRRTSWAVRELQGAAKLGHVAVESGPRTRDYPDRLEPVANPTPYAGPVSGVVNQATRLLIGAWLAARWRCPVVVTARTVVGGAPGGVFAGKDNVWAPDEVTGTTPRVFVRDLSGYYSLPGARQGQDAAEIGAYAPPAGTAPGGPVVEAPGASWAEAEMLPERLVGPGLGLSMLTAAQRSTFKVVRAVSEVAGRGYFDAVDASGPGLLTLGPGGWVLGAPGPTGVGAGELGAYLAYLRSVDGEAFDRALGFFGVRADGDWLDQAGAPALFDHDRRVYASWFSLQGEDGTYQPVDRLAAEADWLRSWHWVYRLAMAARTIDGLRLRMWPMARLALRELLATPWDSAAGVPAAAGGAKAVLGDLFTSERAVALVAAWHALRPGDVVANGASGPRLLAVVARAGLTGSADPRAADQGRLLSALHDEAVAAALSDLGAVEEWPRWAAPGAANPRGYRLDPAIGRLDAGAGSFLLDASDLTPAPAGV
jgi:RHS repeat-associated protein